MYKHATVPEDVIVLFEEAEYINDISRLARIDLDHPKLIKGVSSLCPIDCTLKFKDVSLAGRGYSEDETFAINPLFLKNIRRGNTLIEILRDGLVIKDVVGRKGLNKFFDL